MQSTPIADLFVGLCLGFLIVSPVQSAEPAAYVETIVTPHWIEKKQDANGTLNALFLVNDLARREPDELGQRFDLAVKKVRTLRGSSAYKNVFDLDQFAADLAENPDLLVVSASKPWEDLGPKGTELVRDWVRQGGRLVVFTRNSVEREWKELSDDESPLTSAVEDITESVAKGLNLEPIFPGKFRDSFNVSAFNEGKGRIVMARPFDRALVRFNAFFPKILPWDSPEVARETAYVLAHRILRHAAGNQPPIPEVTATVSGEKVSLAGLGDHFSAQVRSVSSGQLLASGEKWPLEIPAIGAVDLFWEKSDAQGKRQVVGSLRLELGEAIAFEVDEISGSLPRGEPIPLTWKPFAEPGQSAWRVEAELYDADRNLVRFATAPANAGELDVPGWQSDPVTYSLRTVLYDSADRMLAEQLQWIHVQSDPEAEQNQWTTLSWADERGDLPERWRGHRHRELGLNAIAPIGRNVAANSWASASGLRLVPTNVFVPKNRFNEKKFDEAQSKEWFREMSTELEPLSVLGYSFADEPPADVLLPWLEKGEAILRKANPGARAGYCGVFPGAHSPELMKRSGYLGLYSPKHLYNLDIWLGVERDIYRSFRSPDSIVTIWTHYAPWADHEPYSRTVPWVWLFDEMDGVGYFKSTGMMFGCLDGDLRSTHETRWWSEEIKELNAGVAEQVKRMDRDRGEIAILFGQDIKAVEPWARAFNRLSIPYRFVDVDTDLAADVQLLICVDPLVVDEKLVRFAQSGRTVIGGGGLASAQTAESAVAFASVFGFSPDKLVADADSDYRGIRSSIQLGETILEGLTVGECLPAGTVSWQTLGDENSAVPDSLKTLADSAGAIHATETKATYLALKPDAESIAKWVPDLIASAGIASPGHRIFKPDTRGEIEDRVYLATFSDGVGELVGIVPDYMRLPAVDQVREIAANAKDNEDSPQKQQQIYFQHGKNRWDGLPTRLVFGKRTHAYDVRRGSYLGEREEQTLTVNPGHPKLIALLPYGPPELRLQGPKKVRPGERFAYHLTLNASGQPLARHVIRMTATGANGREIPHTADNLYLEDGEVKGAFVIPHGQSPGDHTVSVRDILTGVSTSVELEILPALAQPTRALAAYEFRVERTPVDWPEGEWEPIPEAAAELDQEPAFTSVKKLQRKAIHYGNYNGKEHLISGFKIGNGLREYEMKYLVCCDSSLFDPGPPQMVHGLNGSGLGMNKPRGHLWYYNSYLKLYLGEGEDQEMALSYELAKIEDRSNGDIGAVRLEWVTPTATVWLDYMMIPGHEGLFQKLTLKPHAGKSITHTSVNFSSYPAGFGNGGKVFLEEAQEHREWLLMGDAIRDRDFYETGKGSAGLLVQPEEWSEINYSSRPILKANRPEDQAHQPWQLHWVTWMFPERGNAAAKAYMRTNSEETSRLLSEIFSGE